LGNFGIGGNGRFEEKIGDWGFLPKVKILVVLVELLIRSTI
jgi:hypothetical protein